MFSSIVALCMGGSENVPIKTLIMESGCSLTCIELLWMNPDKTACDVCVCCFQGAICCHYCLTTKRLNAILQPD